MNGHGETPNGLGVEVLPETTILIAGGGPVGLTLATTLAFYGVRSVILERNPTTTRWPKMDLTNVRSMELFRKLGLADELRKQGVPSHLPYPVLISTGMGSSRTITEWQHGTIDEYRTRIAAKNDGSMPLEPWQRLSQAVLEKWLKGICDTNPLIDVRFGCKVDDVEELEGGVRITTTEVATGKRQQIVSKYLVGCDGGSSRVRRSLGIALDGGPMPIYVLLVRFRSRDLSRLHKHGRFWHIFFIGEHGLGAAAIAQNEKDIFTTHLLLPMDVDSDAIGSEEAVYKALGGLHGPYPITIDEVLVRSTYRPNIAISRNYSGFNGHVYLAGDSAHQNIPTGGYGMNMGIADAFELGWKMAAVANGYAGPSMLKTYEQERRPTAMNSIERSGVHMKVHMQVPGLLDGKVRELDSDTPEGDRLRRIVQDHYTANDGENTDLGIEMGYRYTSSIVIPDGTSAPAWAPSTYVPTTFPGCRAPNVFLRNGTSIIDEFGKDHTLVEFSDNTDLGASHMVEAAWRNRVPMKHLVLVGEENARAIYECNLVLVRPDGHVAWRSDQVNGLEAAVDVVAIISGRKETQFASERSGAVELVMDPSKVEGGAFAFTSTSGLDTQTAKFELEKMGGLQS